MAMEAVLDVIKARNNKKNAKVSDFKGSVINVSMKWDMSNYPNPIDFEEAWTKAVNAGIAVAAVAGNENKKSIGVPARSVTCFLSFGAVDVNCNRWAKSNYKGNMNIWAPGAGVKSAIHTSDTATEYLASTSMATPHVSRVIALMVGWEGGSISSNARSVYERIEQNQIMAVTADQVIVDSGAITAPLQTGINHQAKPANQPYAGIRCKQRSVAPRQEVKDGDADMWQSFDHPVLECEGVEKEPRWVERNQLAEIIEREFCPEASKQEFPDGRELFIGLSRFTRRYGENRPDAVPLPIQFPAGIYYTVNRESCIEIMRGNLLDTCDG
ncbi:subtilase [Colletotrichum gloeosporioides Cg-14]|uniref:Subtilase n=1 Tax=Colletotrichum gloeosporioides (strain Cg-14) TaxID=1237896 RepID=T0LFQ9_COLGC|nr:subtilase [Colletotrichum gloeosporioides Cg-14]